MPLAIFALAVLALGLLAVVAVLRQRLAVETNELEQRTAELGRTRHELSEAVDRARVAESQHASSSKELTVSQEELSATQGELAELNDELDEADTLAESQSAELASLAIETEELKAKLDKAKAESKPHGVDPATLWELELARSERTWRYSVAINPDDLSPFIAEADLLRLAVETEAAALRDEVGAFLTVDWQADEIDDPARSLLILRLSHELLNKASRINEPTVLVVTTETEAGNIVLRLQPTEDGDTIDIDLRDFHERNYCSNGLVVPSDEGELRVTVLNLR